VTIEERLLEIRKVAYKVTLNVGNICFTIDVKYDGYREATFYGETIDEVLIHAEKWAEFWRKET
jgi:hypothetical protein